MGAGRPLSLAAGSNRDKPMVSAMKRLLDLVGRQPRIAIFAEALLFALGVGALDYVSGYDVSMFVFYGVPILAVAWWCDWKGALALALICAVIWWWADSLTGHVYEHGWIRIWEPTARFGYFGFVAIAGSALRKQRDATYARIALLEHSQRLERQIIKISEREQRRIGRDLHDGLCQYFAAVGCAAASLKSDLDHAGRSEEAAVAEELTELLEQGVVHTRELARSLVPVQMHEAGLAAALEQLAASVSRLQNVSCTFFSEGGTTFRAPPLATHLYRIAQEAIQNAIRHGGAQNIQIRLRTDGETATLHVIDNGTGIARKREESDGMGLSIMNYRARIVGGTLQVTSPKSGGTSVTCTFPRTSLAAEANGESA